MGLQFLCLQLLTVGLTEMKHSYHLQTPRTFPSISNASEANLWKDWVGTYLPTEMRRCYDLQTPKLIPAILHAFEENLRTDWVSQPQLDFHSDIKTYPFCFKCIWRKFKTNRVSHLTLNAKSNGENSHHGKIKFCWLQVCFTVYDTSLYIRTGLGGKNQLNEPGRQKSGGQDSWQYIKYAKLHSVLLQASKRGSLIRTRSSVEGTLTSASLLLHRKVSTERSKDIWTTVHIIPHSILVNHHNVFLLIVTLQLGCNSSFWWWWALKKILHKQVLWCDDIQLQSFLLCWESLSYEFVVDLFDISYPLSQKNAPDFICFVCQMWYNVS